MEDTATPLGMLMLETRFARIPGDIANPSTFPFPMLRAVVPGATAGRVVDGRAEGLLAAFIAAGHDLVARGAAGIVTSCGFMALHQAALAEALPVPVATSSLLQVPMVERLLPCAKRCGILTIAAEALTPAHLEAVGVAGDTPIFGLPPTSHFRRVFMDEGVALERGLAGEELAERAAALIGRHPETGALVLECTNMGSYSRLVAERTGLPVFDVVSFVTWFHQGLQPRRHPPPCP